MTEHTTPEMQKILDLIGDKGFYMESIEPSPWGPGYVLMRADLKLPDSSSGKTRRFSAAISRPSGVAPIVNLQIGVLRKAIILAAEEGSLGSEAAE